MSDTTNEVTPVTREQLDDLGQMMLGRIDAWGVEANNCQNVIAAANSDDAKALVTTLRPTHPRYDEWQDLVAKAESIVSEIDKDNESKVEKPSESDVTAANETLASLREQAKGALTFLVGAYGDGAKDLMPASLKAKRGGGAKGTTGIKRPRMEGIVVTDSANDILWQGQAGAEKPEDKATFSALAKWLSDVSGTKVETTTLQDHAFEAAGTKDLSKVDKVEFTVTIGESHYNVAATSKVSDK